MKIINYPAQAQTRRTDEKTKAEAAKTDNIEVNHKPETQTFDFESAYMQILTLAVARYRQNQDTATNS